MIRVTENVIYHIMSCLKLDKISRFTILAARFSLVNQQLYYYLQQ